MTSGVSDVVDSRSSVGCVAGLASSPNGGGDASADRGSLARVAGGVRALRNPISRRDDLSRCELFDASPWEVEDDSIDGRGRLIARLERACRNERQRGIAGHWTYSKPRHEHMYRTLKIERAELAVLRAQSTRSAA